MVIDREFDYYHKKQKQYSLLNGMVTFDLASFYLKVMVMVIQILTEDMS